MLDSRSEIYIIYFKCSKLYVVININNILTTIYVKSVIYKMCWPLGVSHTLLKPFYLKLQNALSDISCTIFAISSFIDHFIVYRRYVVS